MKKSILTLAVLAAVCPAAFAADADTIKTIVWNTTTDPVLTNLTFDYTGAQLKAGSNGKSYFDVVDVIGATGRKDDVGLVVNANGSVNSSGDTQVIVLDISGDADVNFGGSTLDVALDTDLVGTGNNMAAALLVWNAKTEVSADVSNFTVKSTNAQGKSVYGLVVNNKGAQLHLTGRTVNVVVESATERTTDKQYSEALGLDIAAGTLSSSEGTTLNIKGRSSTLTADKVSSNNSTLYVSDVATADVVNLATSGNTTVIVDDTKNTVNFGSVTKSEQSDTITTVGSSRFNEQYASAEDAAKAVLDVVTTGTGENKTTAADKVVVEESESNGSFTADLKQDENGNTVFDQSTVTHTLNTKTERIGKTVAQNIHAWRLEMNDMNKRLGELRDCEGNAGVWARVNAGKQKIDGSKNDFTQLQFGADAKIEALANIHAGVAFSYTNSDLSYAGGEGDNNVFGLAAYGSWLGDNGSFIDVIARVARLESDSMIDGTAADFNTTAYSISGEIGHRFDLAPTVFIEPQAEMSWGYVDGKTFSTVNKVTGIAVDTTVDSTTSLIGRLGVRAGITCPNKKGTAYVRTSVLHEFDGDVSVTRGDGTYREDAGDTWFEYAIGGSYNLTGTTQFYADLSRTSNAEIAEPWRFNVGARWAF